jgi:hypothetical protein
MFNIEHLQSVLSLLVGLGRFFFTDSSRNSCKFVVRYPQYQINPQQ